MADSRVYLCDPRGKTEDTAGHYDISSSVTKLWPL